MLVWPLPFDSKGKLIAVAVSESGSRLCFSLPLGPWVSAVSTLCMCVCECACMHDCICGTSLESETYATEDWRLHCIVNLSISQDLWKKSTGVWVQMRTCVWFKSCGFVWAKELLGMTAGLGQRCSVYRHYCPKEDDKGLIPDIFCFDEFDDVVTLSEFSQFILSIPLEKKSNLPENPALGMSFTVDDSAKDYLQYMKYKLSLLNI